VKTPLLKRRHFKDPQFETLCCSIFVFARCVPRCRFNSNLNPDIVWDGLVYRQFKSL
jgi:hypothetical protein